MELVRITFETFSDEPARALNWRAAIVEAITGDPNSEAQLSSGFVLNLMDVDSTLSIGAKHMTIHMETPAKLPNGLPAFIADLLGRLHSVVSWKKYSGWSVRFLYLEPVNDTSYAELVKRIKVIAYSPKLPLFDKVTDVSAVFDVAYPPGDRAFIKCGPINPPQLLQQYFIDKKRQFSAINLAVDLQIISEREQFISIAKFKESLTTALAFAETHSMEFRRNILG